MDVFAQARNGMLNAVQLTAYLQHHGNTVNDVDTRGARFSILSTAIKAGQATTVRFLLDQGANPRLPSGHGCYPLWVAANAKKNRPEIVQMLLGEGARPDETSDDCDNDTPLMVAITQSRDCKVISLLVDARASLDKTNNDGVTARELAEQSGDARILTAIAPAAERPLARPELVNALVSLTTFILDYVNSGVLHGVVKGVVSTMYHINQNATPNAELAAEIGQPTTVEDFKQSINTYVEDSGLGQFFAGNPEFLQGIAEKAAELRQDPNNLLTEEDQIRDLTTLALYKPIFFCDDSGSMRGQRLESQKALVQRMAKIATKLVPDGTGVKLDFIHSTVGQDDLDEAGLQEVLNSVRLSKGTPIGTRLRDKILEPLIYNKLDHGERLTRPYLIMVITDGDPTRELPDTLKKNIVECMTRLNAAYYEPEAVRFGVSRVGNEEAARLFLKDLRSDVGLKRVVYCTTEQLDENLAEFKENDKNLESWLLQVLMSPITNRGLD
ncbi:hypothetical protein S40293_00520 [Stachybotrys chartarum IBT 40293]|nr:hypothetical protein S40293_00520 [Stachybotrys chartarum IBT 40293]